MATIIKKENKSGISYRIQVRVKNQGNGKPETKVAYWKKPDGMNEREGYRKAQQFALEFEEKVRSEVLRHITDGEIKLEDYTKIWLEQIYKNRAISYYSSSQYVVKQINDRLGKYRLKELTPLIIQRYINGLNNVMKEVVTITATKLEDRITELKMSQCKLYMLSGVSKSTIKSALLGENIKLDSAERLAKALECKTEELFRIERRMEQMSTPSMVKNYRILRTILATAKKQCLIANNYASSDYITSVKEQRKPISYLDDIEAHKLAKGLWQEEDIRIKTALLILLMTGMRRGEVCGLEWSDLDFVNDTLTVNRSAIEVANMGVVTKDPKSEKSKRTISLSSSLIQLLKEYRSYWENITNQLGDKYDGNNRLFLQDIGKPMHPSTLRFWLRKVTEKLGLSDVNVHSLRHTNITMQIMAGVPLKTVSVRAGHNSTKVTSDIYSHFLLSSDKEAADTIDKMFAR